MELVKVWRVYAATVFIQEKSLKLAFFLQFVLFSCTIAFGKKLFFKRSVLQLYKDKLSRSLI